MKPIIYKIEKMFLSLMLRQLKFLYEKETVFAMYLQNLSKFVFWMARTKITVQDATVHYTLSGSRIEMLWVYQMFILGLLMEEPLFCENLLNVLTW